MLYFVAGASFSRQRALPRRAFRSVTGIPAVATQVSLVIDGPGIIGSLSTVQSFSAGTTSTISAMGLSVGGPYRIRAKAYDGTSNGNMLLRSGKATGIMIAVGSAVANIALADISVTLDPSTPASGGLGRFCVSNTSATGVSNPEAETWRCRSGSILRTPEMPWKECTRHCTAECSRFRSGAAGTTPPCKGGPGGRRELSGNVFRKPADWGVGVLRRHGYGPAV